MNMNILRAALLAAVLALVGCATCREHPVACGIASAIVVGSIAAAAEHHHDQHVFLTREADPGLRTHCPGTPGPGCNP